MNTKTALTTRREVVKYAAGLGLLAPFALGQRGAGAQDASPTAIPAMAADASKLADHPIVGFWKLSAFAGHALFTPGGQYIEANPYGYGQGIGIWRPTGDRTVDVLLVFPAGDPNAGTDAPIARTMWWGIEVSEDGAELAGKFVWAWEREGQTYQSNGTVWGDRITFESNPKPE